MKGWGGVFLGKNCGWAGNVYLKEASFFVVHQFMSMDPHHRHIPHRSLFFVVFHRQHCWWSLGRKIVLHHRRCRRFGRPLLHNRCYLTQWIGLSVAAVLIVAFWFDGLHCFHRRLPGIHRSSTNVLNRPMNGRNGLTCLNCAWNIAEWTRPIHWHCFVLPNCHCSLQRCAVDCRILVEEWHWSNFGRAKGQHRVSYLTIFIIE